MEPLTTPPVEVLPPELVAMPLVAPPVGDLPPEVEVLPAELLPPEFPAVALVEPLVADPPEPEGGRQFPFTSSPFCEQQAPGQPFEGETPSGTQHTGPTTESTQREVLSQQGVTRVHA